MKEEENLLTQEEIQKVLLEAQNPKYSDPYALGFGSSKTSIFKLSRQSGLILIYGNKDTGVAFGILAIFFSTITTIQSCNANDKRLNLILEDSKEMKMQITNQEKEINFLRMQIDTLKQVQLQQSDSTKNAAIRDLKSQIQ